MHTCVSPSCSTCVSFAAVSSEGLNQESRMRSVAPLLYVENFLETSSELYYRYMKVGMFTYSVTSLRAWGSALLSTGDAMGHSLGDKVSGERLDVIMMKATSISKILVARPRSPNPMVTSQPAALFAEGTSKCGVIFVR